MTPSSFLEHFPSYSISASTVLLLLIFLFFFRSPIFQVFTVSQHYSGVMNGTADISETRTRSAIYSLLSQSARFNSAGVLQTV